MSKEKTILSPPLLSADLKRALLLASDSGETAKTGRGSPPSANRPNRYRSTDLVAVLQV